MKVFSEEANFSKLEGFSLNGNELSKDGFEYLSRCNIPKLKALDIGNTKLNE